MGHFRATSSLTGTTDVNNTLPEVLSNGSSGFSSTITWTHASLKIDLSAARSVLLFASANASCVVSKENSIFSGDPLPGSLTPVQFPFTRIHAASVSPPPNSPPPIPPGEDAFVNLRNAPNTSKPYRVLYSKFAFSFAAPR